MGIFVILENAFTLILRFSGMKLSVALTISAIPYKFHAILVRLRIF